MTVAIIGAGIAGLGAALALRKTGLDVALYEQAEAFGRVGSAINLTANAVKVLDGVGVGEAVRAVSNVPDYRISRQWDTNEETSKVPIGAGAENLYGATTLSMHRADLLAALAQPIPEACIHLNKKLVGLERSDDGVVLSFADGTSARADGVIGADGIHSVVREALFGPESPVYAGMLAYRATVPVERLAPYTLTSFIKWWGPTPQSQVVVFPISGGRELYVFASVAQDREQRESWSYQGDIADFHAAFADWHSEPRAIVHATEEALVTALYERAPLEHWADGPVAVLGDACHAMMPFMAQGAGMGLEDAAVLARCAEANADWSDALRQYERTRIERASTIQLNSHRNEWMKQQGNPDWVYGYDAWSAPLA